MKTMFRWTSALCMLSVSTMASAQSPGFTVGYNEAWFENYGNWLASNLLFGQSSAFNSVIMVAVALIVAS